MSKKIILISVLLLFGLLLEFIADDLCEEVMGRTLPIYMKLLYTVQGLILALAIELYRSWRKEQ